MVSVAGVHQLQPTSTAPPDSSNMNRSHRRRPDAVIDAAAAAVSTPEAIKPYLCLSSDTLSAVKGGMAAGVGRWFWRVGGLERYL